MINWVNLFEKIFKSRVLSFLASASSMESTWVDPGVYSVMISLIMAGVGLNWIQDAKPEN